MANDFVTETQDRGLVAQDDDPARVSPFVMA
jgi:hypothetical protein